MSDILVTGGTGLIGRSLLPVLVDRGRVWATARSARESRVPGVRWIPHDLAGPELPRDLPERIDTVVHLAQSPRFREFPDHARDIFGVNVASTVALLDWARRAGARRFIYASSGGIYGHGEREFRENDPIHATRPLGFYLASKQCGELLVESYAEQFTVVILRFFFVYGRGQRPSMLIPRLVRSVVEGRPVLLQGGDGLRLNPTHVSDAVRAITAALELEESHKINVAGPEVLTLREVATTIGRHVGREPIFEVRPDQEPGHLVGDIGKMSRLLAPPTVRFEEGVRELCADAQPA